jgi:hypothetical protein
MADERNGTWDEVWTLFAHKGAQPTRVPGGGWHVQVDASDLEASEILRVSPVEFAEECNYATGNDVGDGVTGSLHSSEAGLAMLFCYEHWQSGCGARLVVYPDLEAYRAARERWLNDALEEYCGDEEWA